MNNTDALLTSPTNVVSSNCKAVSRLGAQVVVMCKLLDTTLPHLTATQCAEISKAFRHAIEDAMSLMDDIPLTVEYHSTLLEQTNTLLTAPDRKSTAHK
ncbi:hypothetical protein FSO04_18760 [Paraburkholderia madseniana]|uniref:Uncharacterized protein n=1 Tax=Paraburkholderia madseniana TaxID=2599607 RepID=A0A6N6WCQ3_9BURK|nr:hypothetical protein FSO04_18760 [Paraburkholderia madseniana]